MKAFINLLIEDESTESADEILDVILANCEDSGIKVVWSKCSKAND